jgi:hypothetical protein
MPFGRGTSSSRVPTRSTGFSLVQGPPSVRAIPFLSVSLPHLLLAVVDNHRVLHGRSAFTGKRRMCGAYIGVDEYRSKLAVLREKFATKSDKASESEPVTDRSIWSPAL